MVQYIQYEGQLICCRVANTIPKFYISSHAHPYIVNFLVLNLERELITYDIIYKCVI